MNPAQFLTRTFDVSLGNVTLSPSYFIAGAVLFLLFLLVLTLAQVRRHFLNWSIKGSIFGIFLGFLLALILEGFLIIGGKTAVTEILGWKNAPKPIVNVLEAGRGRLISVLGVSSEIRSSQASSISSETVVYDYLSLPQDQAEEVYDQICKQ